MYVLRRLLIAHRYAAVTLYHHLPSSLMSFITCSICSRCCNLATHDVLQLRLSAQGLPDAYKPDAKWKSTLNFRLRHTFTVYADTKESCEQLVAEIKADPESFASLVQLEIAISAEKQSSRTISITGRNIGESKMFAQLQAMDPRVGKRFLTSHDLSDFAYEIVSGVIASEMTTGDYIENADQLNFAQLLERQLSTETADAQRLTTDEWKLVFWRNEFTRPDRYAKYLNHAIMYDEGTETFSFDNETEAVARRLVLNDTSMGNSASTSVFVNAEASGVTFIIN